ncbi:MAG: alginate O-acetyltransferase AlgX-related protein [Vulcanimicrobiaceae bacterium]
MKSHPSRAQFLAGAGAASVAGRFALAPRAAGAVSLVLVGKSNWLFPAWESLTDAGEPGITRALDTIAEANRVFAAHGVGLLVVIAPLKARLYQAQLPANVTLSDPVRTRYDRLLMQAKARGIATFDAAAAVAAVSRDGHLSFYRTDVHWTAWSAEAAATAAAHAIGETWPQPAVAGGGAVLGDWITQHHVGDLAALLPAPVQAAIGEEAFVVRKPAAGAGLLGAADVRIQTVGNSFVGPYLGFTQKLSNVLAQPVGLTWKTGDTGPWKVLLDYVESTGFKQRPRVIVWQFLEGQMMYGPTAPDYWIASSQISERAWLARLTAALAA